MASWCVWIVGGGDVGIVYLVRSLYYRGVDFS